MISGFILVFLGNFLRLGAGLLVLVLLARCLGPQAFGAFSYWLAVATLASIPVNFGLGALVLREFGVAPGRKVELLAAALSARLLLAACVLSLGLLLGLTAVASPWELFMPLLLAQVFDVLTELYGLGFRAGSAYQAEAKAASFVAALHLAIVGFVGWTLRDASAAAWAFCVSRLLGLLWTALAASRAFQPTPLGGLRSAWKLLRGGWAYAVELAFSTAYTQLDSVLIQALLGLKALGIYQAGMKLVQGFSRLAPMLAFYVLPRLTARLLPAAAEARAKRATAALVIASFAAIGALFGGTLALAATPISQLLFGPAYGDLIGLLPLFGGLLALRFVETGAGLVLVALGLQQSKVWLVALQLLLMLAVGWWALQQAGLAAWLWTSIACTLLLLLLYGWLWRRHGAAA